MNQFKFNKEQIKKVCLSAMGLVFLLYVYFSFFLGPLERSRNKALVDIKELQAKLDNSKTEITKAAKLEQTAKDATVRFAALKSLSPEGAPIAWFPPRIKAFLANLQIDKAGVRLGSTGQLKQAELSAWMSYAWLIDLPQSDYATLGRAIARLENSEPLLIIDKLNIRVASDDPQFQQVTLSATTFIPKQ